MGCESLEEFVHRRMLAPSIVLGTTVAAMFPALPVRSAGADAPGPHGAIAWFQAHTGDSSYENLCERAAETAWGTIGVWPTARAHWEGAIAAGKAHPVDAAPPPGAFVYWRTSQDGHVGIADGRGGFFSSNVAGAIGHGDTLAYFPGYLGWSDPQVPA
jgi:hypothetical protein